MSVMNGGYADCTFVRLSVGLYQIGKIKIYPQIESFCIKNENLHGCRKNGVETTQSMQKL
jgi:hypothetical protein